MQSKENLYPRISMFSYNIQISFSFPCSLHVESCRMVYWDDNRIECYAPEKDPASRYQGSKHFPHKARNGKTWFVLSCFEWNICLSCFFSLHRGFWHITYTQRHWRSGENTCGNTILHVTWAYSEQTVCFASAHILFTLHSWPVMDSNRMSGHWVRCCTRCAH